MKNFISVNDVADINALVQNAIAYKAHPLKDIALGTHKRIGLLFLNPSLRTRLSTQIAAANLGMEAIVFNMDKEGWKLELEDGAIMDGTTVEHIKDAAPILGSYFDILCVRTFPSLLNRDDDYNEVLLSRLIEYAGLPIVSLESATLHPLQSLTDIITITENYKETRKPKIVLTWAPHIKPIPQCVSNSFAQWINAWGEADFTITHPEGYELGEQYTAGATITHNQQQALEGADFVYVKNWSSYKDYGKVLTENPEWMLTNKHLAATNHAKVMHCLPVRRNVELSDEILDGPQSLVSQQGANRVWAAQAVISELLKN
ncbi:MAG: acetylornithine carbamoyltransferase [Flavipsychrobacter sp.]|nr:acetylornithine carbamoyltransferase [Flavipsychrobacter sp.]